LGRTGNHVGLFYLSGLRGQNGYNLNPVKFSLNCFLAALFMEPPGPVYVCGLGENYLCWGECCGVGGSEFGGYFLISFVHLEQ
jgi:hypothetical protein